MTPTEDPPEPSNHPREADCGCETACIHPVCGRVAPNPQYTDIMTVWEDDMRNTIGGPHRRRTDP